MMGDGRGRRKTSENIGKRRGTTGTVGDDKMSSVLVLGSYLSGEFRKRRDGTTKCRPHSTWPRTDGLPRCEHCPEFQIRLEDIFGNDLPEVHDPKDSIMFSLCELEAHLIGSLQETIRSRALQRAKKHMKEKWVWKERETFTQSKCRRRY